MKYNILLSYVKMNTINSHLKQTKDHPQLSHLARDCAIMPIEVFNAIRV